MRRALNARFPLVLARELAALHRRSPDKHVARRTTYFLCAESHSRTERYGGASRVEGNDAGLKAEINILNLN